MLHFPTLITNLPISLEQFNAFELLAEDCKILFSSYSAHQNILEHSHETENIGIITNGELVLIIDGVQSSYHVGQWYHIPKNVMHEAKFLVDTSTIEFWFKDK